ncbi:MAG: hypothetical protein IIX64_01395 [Bacteroidales bacterium]|nr:hypothetical protein [Bacteroidales bacterium]
MMKKNIILLSLLFCSLIACTVNEAPFKDRLSDYEERLAKIKASLTSINSQVEALGTLTQGNVITSLSQDSDGKYIINYLGADGKSYSTVVATKSEMINVPQLAVKKDETLGIYFWTIVDPDGSEQDLLDENGKRVPVSGSTPQISANADGYWTVDGNLIKDAKGNPIMARDGESCIFQDIRVNEDGDMEVVLGGGKTIILPMQQVLNLTLSEPINKNFSTIPSKLDITYTVSGSEADNAIVALCGVAGVTASLNEETKTISVTFPSGFTAGYVVVIAYDQGTHSVIRPVFFGEGDTPITPEPEDPGANVVEIGTADQLLAFAAAVNNQDGSETKTAILTNNINMSGKTWVPIGKPSSFTATWSSDAVSSGTISQSGAAFKGTFNGQGYTISNLNLNVSTGGAYGVFGLLNGATVKNLKVSGTMTASNTSQLAAGVIAGASVNSTIDGCTTDVAVTINGSSASNVRLAVGGIAGIVYSSGTNKSTIKNCITNGDLVSTEKNSNNGTGSDGVLYAGIAAMTFTDSRETYNVINNCVNNGNLPSSKLARSSGIVSCCINTELNTCTNNGNHKSTASNGRIGNIASYICYSKLIDCVNTGSLTTTQTTTATGGLGGLFTENSSASGGRNSGTITSAYADTGSGMQRGLLFGNMASFTSVDGITAGGSLYAWNGGSPTRVAVNSSNYMQYIGRYTEANASKITNIICAVETVSTGISNLAELQEFASLVNAGSSYAKFQDGDGVVNLLFDIDMASVSSWTPIGNATLQSTDDIAFTITGNSFTGKFDGGGHTIKNIKFTSTTATNGVFGLFGVTNGAQISNLNVSGTFTASATGKSHVAPVVGAAVNSVLSGINTNVNITSSGTTNSSQRFSIGGIAGAIINSGAANAVSEISNCTTSGTANVSHGSNANIGFTSVMFGGIVSLSTGQAGTDNTGHSVIKNCINNINLTTSAGRAAGIVGSCKQYTKMESCTNNGSQTNTSTKNRLGQITAALSGNCRMDNCINNGDLIATSTSSDSRVGGMAGAIDAGTIQGGQSNGRVISGNATYRGLIFGYISNCTAVKDVQVKGLLGAYNSNGNHSMVNVTSSNFDTFTTDTSISSSYSYSYLGAASSSKNHLVTGCTLVK